MLESRSQQSAEILHSQTQLSIVIHVEAMNDEGIAVPRELGSSRGQDSRRHQHAEVLVQGNVRESTGGSFDDVAVGQQCGLSVDGCPSTQRRPE